LGDALLAEIGGVARRDFAAVQEHVAQCIPVRSRLFGRLVDGAGLRRLGKGAAELRRVALLDDRLQKAAYRLLAVQALQEVPDSSVAFSNWLHYFPHQRLGSGLEKPP